MKQILCFGDSNTYGLIPGALDRYDWSTRWTGIVGEALAGKGYRVVEEGLCGRTTVFDDPFRPGRRGSELLPVILETHSPVDIVILMLGTNDCKRLYDVSEDVIGLGVKKLLSQIRDAVPMAKILLISPIWLGEDVWKGYDPEFDAHSVEVSKNLKAVYQQIAVEEQIFHLAASDYAAPAKEDREHLDSQGHKALAQAILDRLALMENI